MNDNKLAMNKEKQFLAMRNVKCEMSNSRTPQLRFPGFTGEWEYVNGNELFIPISNKDHNSDLPILALTQDQGAIPRDEINYKVFVSDKSVAGYKVVDVDDFIISLRSFQGGIEYSRYKGLCSPAYIVLRKKNNNVCSDFFRVYFKSFNYIQELNKNLEGIRDGKMISYQQFSEIKLPFPTLPEQQKIASCLSSLDELISASQQKTDALKAHKKGLMQQLFPQPGATTPQRRFPGFTGEWNLPTMAEVFDIRNGYTPSKRESKFWIGGTIPWFRMEDIRENGGILSDSIQHITPLGVKGSGLFKKNSIILATTATIGIHAMLIADSLANQQFTNFSIRKSLVDMYYPKFVYYAFFGIDEWCKRNTNAGGLLSVNIPALLKQPFPTPTLAEQQKIASCLSSLDELISASQQKADALKAHKKGLMQKMFPNGECAMRNVQLKQFQIPHF